VFSGKSEVRFEKMIAYYAFAFRGLMQTFMKAEPPIAEARRLGMPIDKLVDTVMDLQLQAMAKQLRDKAVEGEGA
jgi:hypothetical protein